MASSLPWLNYSDQQRRQMLDVIHLFAEQTTRERASAGPRRPGGSPEPRNRAARSVRRALVLYRMVFGQNRQEDLMAYLLAQFGRDAVERPCRECRIDLSPVPIAAESVR